MDQSPSTTPAAGITAPVSSQTPAAPATSQTDAPSQIPADQLSDPTWGPRLKDLHDRLSDSGRRAKEVETRYQQLESEHKQVKTWIEQNREALREYLLNRGKATKPAAEPSPSANDNPEEQRINALVEEKLNAHRIEQAMRDAYFQLGSGDIAKGHQMWQEMAPEADQVFKVLTSGDPSAHLNHVLDYLRLKRTAASPGAAPAPRATDTETGRGSPAGPKLPDEIHNFNDFQAALTALGASETELLAAQGRFGH